MNFEQIEKLIKLLDETSIHEFKYETETLNLRICKEKKRVQAVTSLQSQSVKQSPSTQSEFLFVDNSLSAPTEIESKMDPLQSKEENLYDIISPMVGTFYAAPNPDADPFVVVGSKVQQNTVVCMIEAMKLFNQIEAEVNGEIAEICVENGQLIEYGQTLFRVRQ